MVEQRGETSNRLRQFIEVIQEWVIIIKSPTALNGKSFNWEPLIRCSDNGHITFNQKLYCV